MNKLKKQIDFIIEIDKAKNIFRRSFITDKSRRENDAEHSWHIAVNALVLKEYAKDDTDISKVIQMLLVHDLVEIYAGDTYIYDDEARCEKAKKEMEAAKKLFGMLDEQQSKEFFSLWTEFEEGTTNEAMYAHVMDRLQPLLLNFVAGDKGPWKENKIKKSQVLEKNEHVFEINEKIASFVSDLIDSAVEKGYLIGDI